MKKLTLVTGGSGFIGSHLVEALVKDGRRIRCLVRKTSNTAHLESLGVELVYGDLLDKESLKNAVKDVSIVYHLAANVRPVKIIYTFKELPYLYYRTNVIGTINLVEACSTNNRVQKFIYYSSISAAGLGVALTEDSLPNPITDYGKSKLEAERFLLNLFRYKNFPVLIVRPGQIYGPRNMPMLVLFKFIKKCMLPSIGNGHSLKPFCYIDNLIKGTLLIEKKGTLGEIYFLADKPCSLRKFAQTIAEELGVCLSSFYLPRNIVYIVAHLKGIFEKIFHLCIYPFCIDLGTNTVIIASADWSCSNNKVSEELNYLPEVDFKTGIRRTVEWYEENGFL